MTAKASPKPSPPRPRGTADDTAVLHVLKQHMPANVTLKEGRVFPADPRQLISEHKDLLLGLADADRWVKKAVLAEAMTGFDNWHKRKLSAASELNRDDWAKREAYALKQALVEVRKTGQRIRSGARLSPDVVPLVNKFRRLTRKTSEAEAAETAAPDEAKAEAASAPKVPRSLPGGSTDTVADIWRAYGLPPPASASAMYVSSSEGEEGASKDEAPQPEKEQVQAIPSDSEAAPVTPAAKVAPDTVLTYFDECRGTMIKTAEDGTEAEATMEPGPKGFQVATFPDGAKVETEVPNLVKTLAEMEGHKVKAKKHSLKKLQVPAGSQDAQPTRENKDPASEKTVRQKPAQADPPSRKRGRPRQELCDVKDKEGNNVFVADRLALKPDGCGRCRGLPGCSDSCWKGRVVAGKDVH